MRHKLVFRLQNESAEEVVPMSQIWLEDTTYDTVQGAGTIMGRFINNSLGNKLTLEGYSVSVETAPPGSLT